jgi:hypothetical protein
MSRKKPTPRSLKNVEQFEEWMKNFAISMNEYERKFVLDYVKRLSHIIDDLNERVDYGWDD